MVRSGLQQDVINLYRQGVRNALTKTPENRGNFLLHLRYNFRHPPLRQRDYTAIEHQLRKMSRTLEMLSEHSTQRISVSREMEDWWAGEVEQARSAAASSSSSSTEHVEASQTSEGQEKEKRGQVTKREREGRDRDQWGGTLPGHGGT